MVNLKLIRDLKVKKNITNFDKRDKQLNYNKERNLF